MAMPVSDALRATAGLLARRQGPEDFPYSPPLAWGLGALAGLTGALEIAIQTPGPFAVVAALGQALVLGGLLGLWLRQRGVANRLPQTFGALMACTLVLNLIEWPALSALAPAIRARQAVLDGAADMDEVVRALDALPPPPALPILGLLALLAWGVAVKTRILERALGIGFWRAAWGLTGLVLAASLLGGALARLVVPGPPEGAGASAARPTAARAPGRDPGPGPGLPDT